jgi:hypothetical protein
MVISELFAVTELLLIIQKSNELKVTMPMSRDATYTLLINKEL